MLADAGYKTLRQNTEIAKVNPNYIVLCTLLPHFDSFINLLSEATLYV